MRRYLFLGILFLVASCSGSNGSGSSDGGRPDLNEVAASFGCQAPERVDGGPELYAAAAVTCEYKGSTITVMSFQSDAAQQRWSDAAKSVTGGDGTVVIGHRFAVEAEDADQADEIAAKVHGRTQ